ncbi:AI-2E family transporter [Schlesneria paludicola]|uniref:AI-2E family transporter n=1 Tax=Schlesneria paludicola TaxID=360056 RepID=UPI00029AC148|nr:AI-2E family transporter [Schlesneria paludicola]
MQLETDSQKTREIENSVAAVQRAPFWQQAIVILCGAVTTVVLVVALQWGRPVLIPVALAVLLTFLMNPLVKMLHRRGVPHLLAVILAVGSSGIVLMGLGWMVTAQVSGMLTELPRNTEKIKAKVKTLRQMGERPTNEGIGQMIDEISKEIAGPSETASQQGGKGDEANSGNTNHDTVIVRSEQRGWFHLADYVGSAVEVLATLGFSLVLLVFFLTEREDLRDRVVLLAGRAKLAITSKALEDVTERISRYIVMVALVNGGFGLVLTIGLLALGVPFALLWGFVAAVLRFLPYIGPWVGAVFPITMSLATSDGWAQPITVLLFVGFVELFTNNVVEPLLFGHTIGVSPTALLVSAAFWLYLWGPVGLVLSAPFAVCLVVIGKNIPQLGFFYLLMGDKPALKADYSYYQRLMLREDQEAADLILKRIRTTPPERIYDEMLIPVLNFTKRDVHRGYLGEEDQQGVRDGMDVSLSKLENALGLSERIDAKVTPETVASNIELAEPRVRILGCAATDESDLMTLRMLKQLLDPCRWDVQIIALETLSSELMIEIENRPPGIVFIASLPPGGLAHSRYLCKRLRKVAPDLSIIVGRCGQKRNAWRDQEELEKAGASFVTNSLLESRNLLNARLPLLSGSLLK